MNRFITLIMLTVAVGLQSMAAGYSVKGIVTDSAGVAEPYATLRVFSLSDTIKPKVTGVTGDDGAFRLVLPSANDYILRITSVGRAPIARQFKVTASEPSADMGTIAMASDERLLDEVTVTATRPLVTKEIDRIGYDVQADNESKTSSLEEMLRKVPLVSVDPDGTIKVKGSENFKIYKNGRPNNSFTKNAKEIFKAIPASMIKKIEVITDPGAREDAEGVGAILNIVTLESAAMKGVMGNVSLNYDNRSEVPLPNIWGSGQIDKVTVSLYGGANRMGRKHVSNDSYSRGTYTDSGRELETVSAQKGHGWITWFGLDGSYEIDSLNLLTAEFGGYYYDMNTRGWGTTTMFNPDGSKLYSYNSRSVTNPLSYFDLNGSVNYQHSTRRKGEAFTLSYMISTTNQKQNSDTRYSDEFQMPVPYKGVLSDFRLNFMEHTFQFDWTRPIGEKHVVDLGLKYIYRDNHSKTKQNYLDYLDQPLIDFSHITQVAAGYADYRLRLDKFNFRAGLRYEFSRLEAKYADDSNPSFHSNLSDWVPNAAVSYSINPANTVKVSFGTRINRPGITYLNPAVSESPTASSQGNPDLGSARSSSVDLNYNLIGQKVNLDFTAGYTFTNNDIVEVQHIENDRLISTYANAGHNKSFNAGLFLQWTAGKKTTVMLNANTSYDHYANPSLNLTHGGWSGMVFARLSQQLPWKLSGSVGVNMWSGGVNGLYGTFRPSGLGYFNYMLSLQRSFLKEDRLTVRVSTWNPIAPSSIKYRSYTVNLPFNPVNTMYRRHLSSFQISVAYRFGSINAQVKKTNKSIQNDDLQGQRSGGNGGDSSGMQ